MTAAQQTTTREALFWGPTVDGVSEAAAQNGPATAHAVIDSSGNYKLTIRMREKNVLQLRGTARTVPGAKALLGAVCEQLLQSAVMTGPSW